MLFGLSFLLFFYLLSFLVLKVPQIASFANAARIQLPVSMLTITGLLLPTLAMVTVPTKSLRIVGCVCVFALRNYTLWFGENNFVLLHRVLIL